MEVHSKVHTSFCIVPMTCTQSMVGKIPSSLASDFVLAYLSVCLSVCLLLFWGGGM